MDTRCLRALALVAWTALCALSLPGCPPDGAPVTDDASVPDDVDACFLRRVDRAVERCCRRNGPYGAYNNCTNFSETFHNLCDDKGITCRSLTASCTGAGAGHAFNMAQFPGGEWCFVEPQRGGGNSVVMPCFRDPANPPPAAVCGIMGTALAADGTCPCTIHQNSTTPLPNNRDPLRSCAGNGTFRGRAQATFDGCARCCVTANDYHRTHMTMGWLRWQCDCTAACYDNFHPDGQRVPSAMVYRCDQYSRTDTPSQDAGLTLSRPDATAAVDGGSPDATPPSDASARPDGAVADVTTTPPRRCPSQQHNREFNAGACVQSWLDDLWYQCTATGWVRTGGAGSGGPAGACTESVPRR